MANEAPAFPARDLAESNERLLQARLRLAEQAGRQSLNALLVATLDEACTLTGSATGFYHFLEPDQVTLSLQAWSTRTTAEFCGATVNDRHYDLDRAGLWADAARHRRSLVINDYAAAQGRKGLPGGHAPVVRMMSVPILRDGLVKAIIGVGNKQSDYDAADLRVVETLADLAWDLTERKRAEDALAERTALVQRRYESLRALNEIAALPPSGDGDQLRRTLDLGAAHLGLPVGIIARIDGEDYQVLHHCAPPGAPLADGQHFALGDTYCALTLQADDVLAIAHMARSPHAGHPCYRAFGLEAYIGAPITVGGQRVGTLNFSSGEPYPRDFDEGDLDFVRVMARWVGSVIERQQADSALRAAKEAAERSARQLANSNADLEQFAYVASHDLRQPLRMVNSYLGLIERRLGDQLDGDIREFIGFARDGAQQMDRLILDLLEYSRVGRHGEEPAQVDLAAVAAEARHLLGVAIEESHGTVEVAATPALVLGNHSELLRLFQNLMGNALKYRAPGRPPVVRVDWQRHGQCWQVSVADNGIGIRPEFMDEIFKIFRRLHSSRDYEGTGVGLAICLKIVKHHHGDIRVESEPGQGSVFHVTLPAA